MSNQSSHQFTPRVTLGVNNSVEALSNSVEALSKFDFDNLKYRPNHRNQVDFSGLGFAEGFVEVLSKSNFDRFVVRRTTKPCAYFGYFFTLQIYI